MSPDKKLNIITLEDAERALSVALHTGAELFPKSVDDVEGIIKAVDLNKVASPDLNRFRESLRNRPALQVPRLPANVTRPEEEVVEDLRAARNGNKLTKHILERMHAHREAAEKEQLG